MTTNDLVAFAIVVGFAVWMTSGEDTVTVYSVLKVESDEIGEPEWLPLRPRTFKIRGDQIVSKVGSSISAYSDCTIYSVTDWQCSYSDGSATFGIRDGEYWENVSDRFSDLSSRDKHVSWFRHAVEGCKWDFYSGGLQVLMCPVRFVMTE